MSIVQATGEALSPQKENIQHFKTRNFLPFFYFCGSVLPFWIRIFWIETRSKPDPDPKQTIAKN
jgi:hypothetical protein